MTQNDAYKLLMGGRDNLFLTGDAGSGKTHLSLRFIEEANRDKPPWNPPVRVLASTGIAATLLNGTTVHSFFGIGKCAGPDEKVIDEALKNKRVLRRVRNAKVAVIDEISMLGARTLGIIEQLCRKARGTKDPFGGLRIVAVGDFNQLCPVDEKWAFTSPVWESFKPAYLTDQYRTQDAEFLEVLKDVKYGEVFEETAKWLNDHLIKPGDPDKGHIRLFSKNTSVDRYNAERLAELPGPEKIFETKYKWLKEDSKRDGLFYIFRNRLPIGPDLKLKVGAQVMIRSNKYTASELMEHCNGDIAIVTGINDDGVLVKKKDGQEILLDIKEFTIEDPDDGESIFAGYNYPLSLCWATSIHKSQGQTLDEMTTDLRACFSAGQFYVSLSRAKSGAGVHLLGWRDSSVIVDPLVREYYERIIG